jgi:GAF domain-containing protein
LTNVISARKPTNESERLNALRGYELLDTESEAAFDAMTRLAATLCRVPIALVSLIDENRQWFKSQCGLPGVSSTGLDVSFCGHAILQNGIFEVPDALEDPRFADNPLVTGEPHVRFYAGMPLIEPGGMPLGTLCVIDRKPRKLTKRQRLQLEDLAQSVVGLILMRIRRSELDEYRLARVENDRACSRLKNHAEQLKRLAKGTRTVA